MFAEVTFRPAGPEDTEFLFRVYATTREQELGVTGWPEAQKTAFLRMQFDVQHRAYHAEYSTAHYLVVLSGGAPIGRLYLDRRERELAIIDIALLPEHRGRGVGRSILEGVLDEAAASGKSVRLEVEPWNPALRLYERLGFRKVGEHPVRLFMEWKAPAGAAPTS